MKHIIISMVIVLILGTVTAPSSAETLGGDKNKSYSNNKIIKRNNKKRHKTGKPMKFHSGTSQIKKRNYPFS